AERVAADPPDHGHGGAESRRRDGLIGPLAAGRAQQIVAGNRLAGPRQTRHPDDQVHIQTTDHCHPQSLHRGMLASAHLMTQAARDSPGRTPAASSRRPYPVLTLRERLVFPLTTFPLVAGREASLRAVEEASHGERQLVLLAQKHSETEEPRATDLHTSGILA